MKIVIRCINCQRIIRRSNAYHVKLVGNYRNHASTITPPDWKEIEEKCWLCKDCAVQAGYQVTPTVTVYKTDEKPTKKDI